MTGDARYPKEFDRAWHARGFQYGEDALDNVRVGWNLAISHFGVHDPRTISPDQSDAASWRHLKQATERFTMLVNRDAQGQITMTPITVTGSHTQSAISQLGEQLAEKTARIRELEAQLTAIRSAVADAKGNS